MTAAQAREISEANPTAKIDRITALIKIAAQKGDTSTDIPATYSDQPTNEKLKADGYKIALYGMIINISW